MVLWLFGVIKYGLRRQMDDALIFLIFTQNYYGLIFETCKK